VGQRNYLIDGVSCSGKTSVATELQRRGYHVIHGDRELAYVGDPENGTPVDEPVALADDRSRAEWSTRHWCWELDKVKAIVARKDESDTFFCGGSRNFSKFIDLFDAVFILHVDHDTLKRRVEQRADEEWGAGGSRAEREEALRLHRTKGAIPDGRVIDATVPVSRVVDEILRACAGDDG
jgi:adenylate kinase family enzyme